MAQTHFIIPEMVLDTQHHGWERDFVGDGLFNVVAGDRATVRGIPTMNVVYLRGIWQQIVRLTWGSSYPESSGNGQMIQIRGQSWLEFFGFPVAAAC